MSSQDTIDPVHPNVAKQKQYQDVAFKSLNIALTIDERSDNISSKSQAVPHYQAGIQSLLAGISLPLPRDQNNPHLSRAHVLRDKMRSNLATAQERLTFLTTSLHLNNLSLKTSHDNTVNNNQSRQQHRPVVRSNTFTKEDNPSRMSRLRCDTSSSTTRVASSPVSSPTRPRINRAAELRLRSSNTGAGKSRSGSVNSITPVTSAKKHSEREGLQRSCQSIKGVDSKLIEMILNEVIPRGSTGVTWQDVSGQDKAKNALHEMVVLPTLRPELFTGIISFNI